jgi:hypothetical protein
VGASKISASTPVHGINKLLSVLASLQVSKV